MVTPGFWGDGRATGPGGQELETREIGGLVARGVARVTVTWPGHPTVTAGVEGPFWLVRLVLPAGATGPGQPAKIDAYDRNGRRLGGTSLNDPRPAIVTPGAIQTKAPPGTPPTDPVALLDECTRFANMSPTDDSGQPQRLQTRVLFRDEAGFLLYAGDDTHSWTCEFRPDGSGVNGSGGNHGSIGDGWSTSQAVGMSSSGTGSLVTGLGQDTTRAEYSAVGSVRRGVTTVVVTWGDAPPVTAAVNGPYWAARLVFPTGRYPETVPATAVAYDAAGQEVGRSTF